MNNNSNIPSPDSNSNADKKKLLSDLSDELRCEEDSFEHDAAEGLKQIPDKKIPSIINQLNTDLHHQISKKKKRKRVIPDQTAVFITIITILILIVAAFIIIRRVMS